MIDPDMIQRWLEAHDSDDTADDAKNYLTDEGVCECCGVSFAPVGSIAGIPELIAEARNFAQMRGHNRADGHLFSRLADALEATVKEIHARELHHFESEKELERLKNQLASMTRMRNQYRNVLLAIQGARNAHPECDKYEDGDVVTCGWKRAIQHIDSVLAGFTYTPQVTTSQVTHHNHPTRDIRPRGECPACDEYWAQGER